MTDKYPNCSEWFHLLPEEVLHTVEADMKDISNDILITTVKKGLLLVSIIGETTLDEAVDAVTHIIQHMVVRYHMGVFNDTDNKYAVYVIKEVLEMPMKETVTGMGNLLIRHDAEEK